MLCYYVQSCLVSVVGITQVLQAAAMVHAVNTCMFLFSTVFAVALLPPQAVKDWIEEKHALEEGRPLACHQFFGSWKSEVRQ